jgi:hypothetical protein
LIDFSGVIDPAKTVLACLSGIYMELIDEKTEGRKSHATVPLTLIAAFLHFSPLVLMLIVEDIINILLYLCAPSSEGGQRTTGSSSST